jgi:hypothetical protein
MFCAASTNSKSPVDGHVESQKSLKGVDRLLVGEEGLALPLGSELTDCSNRLMFSSSATCSLSWTSSWNLASLIALLTAAAEMNAPVSCANPGVQRGESRN